LVSMGPIFMMYSMGREAEALALESLSGRDSRNFRPHLRGTRLDTGGVLR
jgi:hypothetical protein